MLVRAGDCVAADDCLKCHGKAALIGKSGAAASSAPRVDEAGLEEGAHGELACVDCHGERYRVVPHSGEGGLYECADCHETEREILAGSAHAGSVPAEASCIDCHGYHDVFPEEDSRSRSHTDNVSRTCGGCHQSILAEYQESVHGVARRTGVADAPTCTGCHGTHSILSSENPASTVYAGNVPAACSKCHAEEAITRKYGLATRRLETYEDSFHGIANRFGEAVVANCASCHGIHKILPSSDPASSIAPANLAATCGKCHVGAGANFAKGKVHVEPTKESSKGMFYVRRFYTWLIGVLVVLFVLHIAMDVQGHRRRKRLEREGGKERTR